VEDLRKWNQLLDNNISIGQKLIIKAPEGTAPAQTNKGTSTSAGNRTTHKVEASQTLYSISRMYGVTTDQLREWNNLSSNSLNVGQLLIIYSNATPPVEVKTNSSMLPAQETINQQKVTEENQKVISGEKNTQTEKVISPVTAPVVINESASAGKMEAPAEKIVKKGIAEVIEDSSDTKKYLALHREAPIGTIMQVKNEMNNQTVFVRVVGTIPNTGDNSKVILKISKKAYDRLGAVDSRFPVELSYIP
jgi:LysM repeat protein